MIDESNGYQPKKLGNPRYYPEDWFLEPPNYVS